MSNGQSSNLILSVLRHRKGLGLKICAGVLCLAGLAAFLMRQYRATAAVALNPEAAGSGGPSAVELAWSSISDQQIQALIQQFHLDSGFVELLEKDEIFPHLRARISLEQIPQPGSEQEIAVSFTAQSRTAAMGVVNSLAGILTRTPKGGRKHAQSLTDKKMTRALLQTQIQANSQAMQILQQKLEGFFRIDGELQKARTDDIAQLASLEEQKQRIEHAHASRTPSRVKNPEWVAQEARVQQAQHHLAQLKQRYTDRYPDVIQAAAELAALEKQLQQLPPTIEKGPAPEKTDPTAALAQIEAQAAVIRLDQAKASDAIQSNQRQAQVVRDEINRIKKQTESISESLHGPHASHPMSSSHEEESTDGGGPLFYAVSQATGAEASGIMISRQYWLLCLLGAFLISFASMLIAEWRSPSEAASEPRTASDAAGLPAGPAGASGPVRLTPKKAPGAGIRG